MRLSTIFFGFVCTGYSFLVADVASSQTLARNEAATRFASDDAIDLRVDATDTAHHVFNVVEKIPLQTADSVTLLHPEWETASHAPTASAIGLAGLSIAIDGRPVVWERDRDDMHAFHIVVPVGAKVMTASFQYLPSRSQALLRKDMIVVPWHRLLLYPKGWPVDAVYVSARLALPVGLHEFSSLRAESAETDVHFRPVTLQQLVDSPVYAGRFWRTFELATPPHKPVSLDVIADKPEALQFSDDEVARLRALVGQTTSLFGDEPYEHYDAIVTLSDTLSPGGGVEHAEESENNLPADYFSKPDDELNNRDLIAHEFVHVWNGFSRVPKDLRAKNLNSRVSGSLLWMYEGQTEFWGRVLADRAGLRTRQQTLDKLALDAALVGNRPGRAWKTLDDSTNDPIYMAGHSVGWRDWQRREDYYSEGVLLWLDVDARLRELTHERAGIDDFARRFFSSHDSSRTYYVFDDICTTLDSIAQSDWSTFLRNHLETHDAGVAMAGLARSGWRLVYKPTPSSTYLQDQGDLANLDYSIGLQVDTRGRVMSVVWGGPAFSAGLAPGDQIIRVNDHDFSVATLIDAVANSSQKAIGLTFADDGTRTVSVLNYRGPLRYPALERIPSTTDRLTRLLNSAK